MTSQLVLRSLRRTRTEQQSVGSTKRTGHTPAQRFVDRTTFRLEVRTVPAQLRQFIPSGSSGHRIRAVGMCGKPELTLQIREGSAETMEFRSQVSGQLRRASIG